MDEVNKQLSVIAYYLSEYGEKAQQALGFNTQKATLEGISRKFGKENSYLKLRRDEFDVLTSSPRKGWRNRKPAPEVLRMFKELSAFSFEQITEIVLDMIDSRETDKNVLQRHEDAADKEALKQELDENELELLLNFKDTTAARNHHISEVFTRVYNKSAIDKLKKLYDYRCQICGCEFQSLYGGDIAEAHHIIPFAESENNNADNIIILCPNHHRLIHKLNPQFEREKKQYIFPNGTVAEISINFHL